MRSACWVLLALLLTSCATLVDLFDPTPDWCPGRKEKRATTIADCNSYGEACFKNYHACFGFEGMDLGCATRCPKHRDDCLIRCVPKPLPELRWTTSP